MDQSEVESEAMLSPTQREMLHSGGRQLLFDQAQALEHLIHEMHELDAGRAVPSIRVPLLMLQAVGVSIHSVLALTVKRDMTIRDGFGIARSAVETAINAAYIAVTGDSSGELAIRHMNQKRFRDQSRQADIAGWKMKLSSAVPFAADDVPGLQEALDEFTDRRGREVRDWTDVRLEDRVAAVATVSRRAALGLATSIFMIYRPASELLHGTFYGVTYFWKGSQGVVGLTRENFDEVWLLDHFMSVLSSLFFSAGGAIEAIAHVCGLTGHRERQDELSSQLSDLVEGTGVEVRSSGHITEA